MTDPLRTPHPTTARLRPFADNSARWDAERSRALQMGRIAYDTGSSTAVDEPYLVHERTGWGWLSWTVPADGSMPERPHQIGVLPPSATWADRLAARWLARRPAGRMALHATSPGSLRHFAVVVAVIGCFAAFDAIARGVPLGIAVPVALLAPLLADHLPDRLDMRARRRVRVAHGAAATGYLQRLTVLHTGLLQAAAGSERYELRRSAEIGQQLLWDAAGLLQTQDTRSASPQLIAGERLMLQLADQVAQIIERAATPDGTADADQAHAPGRPLGPYPPGVRPTTPPTPQYAHSTSPLKGPLLMAQTEPSPAAHTPDVYMLFAHEPYYPGPGTQEINTTVVAADSLLHPQVRQPDGARIHDLLTHGRQPGEIIPLSTLTHELNGGADWPTVGDWESVTTDLLQLVRDGDCDALSLGLPEIARALVCTGPHSHVRAYDAAADDFVVYGASERAAVLDEVGMFLTGIATEQPFWPGDSLLPPLVGRRA
ncbi:hypothetical protein OG819_54910 [Streptomyces sp. NBC_01549]|uniref:hypothetical protein n=1 Tax=Streptomyces sp. NBC_01549 TaxID=2975874 RepID=UPI00225B3142|nr:hypothetical protein [Streptomyces sp. NBC_01549]MCX4598250.1 hypothetical protein [Streptomyces sp. NBC_01549]